MQDKYFKENDSPIDFVDLSQMTQERTEIQQAKYVNYYELNIQQLKDTYNGRVSGTVEEDYRNINSINETKRKSFLIQLLQNLDAEDPKTQSQSQSQSQSQKNSQNPIVKLHQELPDYESIKDLDPDEIKKHIRKFYNKIEVREEDYDYLEQLIADNFRIFHNNEEISIPSDKLEKIFKNIFYTKVMNSHLLGGVGKYNAVLEYLGWGEYTKDRSYFEKIVKNIPEYIYLNMLRSDGYSVKAEYPLNLDIEFIDEDKINKSKLNNIFRRGLYIINRNEPKDESYKALIDELGLVNYPQEEYIGKIIEIREYTHGASTYIILDISLYAIKEEEKFDWLENNTDISILIASVKPKLIIYNSFKSLPYLNQPYRIIADLVKESIRNSGDGNAYIDFSNRLIEIKTGVEPVSTEAGEMNLETNQPPVLPVPVRELGVILEQYDENTQQPEIGNVVELGYENAANGAMDVAYEAAQGFVNGIPPPAQGNSAAPDLVGEQQVVAPASPNHPERPSVPGISTIPGTPSNAQVNSPAPGFVAETPPSAQGHSQALGVAETPSPLLAQGHSLALGVAETPSPLLAPGFVAEIPPSAQGHNPTKASGEESPGSPKRKTKKSHGNKKKKQARMEKNGTNMEIEQHEEENQVEEEDNNNMLNNFD